MSKNKLLKYEVINTKKDKNLIGEVFDFKKVKSKGSDGGDNTSSKKQKSTRDLLVEFMGEQREFNKSVMQRFDSQDKRFDRLENRLDRIVKVNNLKD